MPKLKADEQQAIEELRRAGFSKRKTGDIMGRAKATVANYEPDDVDGYDKDLDATYENINAALSDDLDTRELIKDKYIPDDPGERKGSKFTGPSPGDSPLKDETTKDLRVSSDYSGMTPGDFLREFFNDFEVGVRDNFVQMQSRRADRRTELPDEEKLRSDLREMSSGISNSQEAQYIAEEYWAEAQQYIAEADADVFRGRRDNSGEGAEDGSFVSAGQNQQQEGQWMQIPGQGRVYGQMVQGPNGEMQFQPMNPPGQQGQGMMGQQMPQQGFQQQPQQGQNDEMVQSLLKEIRSLRNEVNDGRGSDLKGQIQELVEMQEAVKQLTDDGQQNQGGQRTDALRNELQKLRRDLAESGGQSTGGDPKEQLIQRAIESDSLDENQVMKLMDRMDEGNDPEVRKKEIERDLKLKEMQQKSERTEKLVEGLQGLVEKAGEGFGRALAGGGGGGSQQGTNQNPQPQNNQPPQENTPPEDDSKTVDISSWSDQGGEQDQQQPGATPDGGSMAGAGVPAGDQATTGVTMTETWECPECGAETHQDPSTPGSVCQECDYSIVPCPDCGLPIDIPPEDQMERGGCPECKQPLMEPPESEDEVACLNCDWMGSYSEHSGDTVECGGCGAEHHIANDPETESVL